MLLRPTCTVSCDLFKLSIQTMTRGGRCGSCINCGCQALRSLRRVLRQCSNICRHRLPTTMKVLHLSFFDIYLYAYSGLSSSCRESYSSLMNWGNSLFKYENIVRKTIFIVLGGGGGVNITLTRSWWFVCLSVSFRKRIFTTFYGRLFHTAVHGSTGTCSFNHKMIRSSSAHGI